MELRDGMALVTTRLVLQSEHVPAEARILVPTSASAGLASLRVCSRGVCRHGRPPQVEAVYETARVGRRFSPIPIASASQASRWESGGIHVEVAPIVPGHPFEVTLRHVAPTSMTGGVVELILPAAGGAEGDPPPTLELDAPGLEAPTILAPEEEGGPHRIRARLPEGSVEASAAVVRCHDAHCVRFRVAAGPVAEHPRDVFLLFDASGSIRAETMAQGAEVVDALVEGVPAGSRFRRLVYAREARWLDPAPLSASALSAPSTLPNLGNRTLFEAAWDLIEEEVRSATDPLVVVIGDGAIAPSARANAALREVVESGAQLAVVALAMRDTEGALAAAAQRSLGEVIEAWGGDGLARLRILGRPIVDPDVRLGRYSIGPLRAGEERVLEEYIDEAGPIPPLRAFGRGLRARPPRGAWADGLAARLSPDEPRRRLVAVSLDQTAAARKGQRAGRGAGLHMRFLTRRARIIRCGWGCGLRIRGSPGRESIARLRARARPAVRACFASARRGRTTWSARATVSLFLRYGELVRVEVPNSTDPTLNACLIDALERVEDIPFGDSLLRANFTFHSRAAIAAPRPIPLTSRMDEALGAIGIR